MKKNNSKLITLVTGADGLVGSAIKRLAPPDTIYLGHKDLDLTDYDKTKKIFQEIRPNRVIHTAAVVGGIGGNMKHPGTYFRDNVLINVNTLEAARLVGVEKLLSFISTCAFPDKITYPLDEKDLHNGPPHDSNFGYAYAKRMLEVQSRAYRKEWGSNYIVAIGTNIYGPEDNFSIENGHVLPALIHKCFLAKKNKSELYVWGSGKPLREFVYSEDVAKLALWALEHYNEEAPIIFSSGIETSIKEAVDIVVKNMQFDGPVKFDAEKPDGQYQKPSKTEKLKRYLPDFGFTDINSGVEATVKWFVENYPKVRK